MLTKLMSVCVVLLAMAPVEARQQKPKPAAPPPQAQAQAQAQQQPPKLVILKADEWNCGVQDVEKVLLSSSGQLWKYFPGRELPVIEVEPKGGPITLFKRGPEGQIHIKLDTGNLLWSQMAYQFAHEFCHILCNYDEKHMPTKWFEESLCETASLFALRRMADAWQVDPPYPNWKSYAPSLGSYAADRIAKDALPAGKTFPQWYKENADALRASSTDRPRNTLVATVLLPLFEAQPEAWEAVTWLNKEDFSGNYTFADHLKAWRRQCPEKHRAFVTKVAETFGIDIGAAE
ncbi:MAG: hypothetical protein NT049_11715 [Planctomycetota bacterium]|nr:hypothetical protein [Planctomycetota bacterium]